ncbi:hypothetical protein AA14337_3146 [Acetobacter malorum DSM 14337]|uniref:Phage protein n=1 Tax=Acetobacter malorum DSM 14337 TaxID=1307910 RepID=A0ABQ0PZX5_9PROT|nr:hypothetical protein [Acetobacter malorum]KXV05724.1 hypothetical protein AD930_11370 [Acetobacter malorum]GBQ85721.1 hypothetical protein AA14337_3146 [Acetobacter malorum DSM 14337]
MSESRYIWEDGPFGIIWDDNAFTCTVDGVSCANSIAAFPLTPEGLGLAMTYTNAANRRRAGQKYTTREERNEHVRKLEQQAREIFALGRRKAHAAWLDK